MHTFIWIAQIFLAFAFAYSGVCKTVFSRHKLIAIGQTGVDGLPIAFIKFIGLAEIAGAMGMVLPPLLNIMPGLTTIAATCFAFVMIPAAYIHYKRKEPKNVATNCLLFALSIFIIYARTQLL
jgi:uncharacterized membrane protein YphA (DoxX/SURF4 family)